MFHGSWLRIQGLGIRGQFSGARLVLGLRVQDLGFSIEGLEFKVLEIRV